eukprot:gene6536-10543_t
MKFTSASSVVVLFLVFNFTFINTEVIEVGCIIWENTFLKIDKNLKTQDEYIFTVHTRQWNGYIGVGIFSKPNFFDDSTSIIAYLPNNFIQLKNHTKQMKKKTIFGESFQGKYDTLDGTYTFGFIMNSSDLIGKNYFAFSKNENSNPLTINGSIIIPKHYTFSKYYHLQLNSTNNFIPVCRFGLNISARITTYHPSIFIITMIFHIFLFFLDLTFMNQQPFKSRFISPYIGIAANYVNTVMEFIFSIVTFEQSSKIYCTLSILFSYAPIQAGLACPCLMIFRYMILLRIHKNKRSLNLENEELKFKMIPYLRKRLLATLASPWIFIGAPLIWASIFVGICLILFASFSFQCTTHLFLFLRYTNVAMFGILCLGIFSFVMVDFILNIKFIIKCKWKKIFFDDDPYNFRSDMIGILFVILPVSIWVLVPLPKVVFAIFTDIILYGGILYSGGQALVITIIKSIIFRIRISRGNNHSSIHVNDVTSPELVDVFVRFCESEWSVENIMFKLDIQKYKSLKRSERKLFSELIKQKYLIPNVSELEINAPVRSMIDAGKLIADGKFEDDLFNQLEKIVDLNLSDTINRFRFSYIYATHLNDIEIQKKTLGL